jgi:hypothetical protein
MFPGGDRPSILPPWREHATVYHEPPPPPAGRPVGRVAEQSPRRLPTGLPHPRFSGWPCRPLPGPHRAAVGSTPPPRLAAPEHRSPKLYSARPSAPFPGVWSGAGGLARPLDRRDPSRPRAGHHAAPGVAPAPLHGPPATSSPPQSSTAGRCSLGTLRAAPAPSAPSSHAPLRNRANAR